MYDFIITITAAIIVQMFKRDFPLILFLFQLVICMFLRIYEKFQYFVMHEECNNPYTFLNLGLFEHCVISIVIKMIMAKRLFEYDLKYVVNLSEVIMELEVLGVYQFLLLYSVFAAYGLISIKQDNYEINFILLVGNFSMPTRLGYSKTLVRTLMLSVCF